MIGRGYESRDLAAGSSRNASPTNHPDHPPPPPLSASALYPIPCILRLPPSSSCAPLDTPQHHPSQPSRILVPHSSLFIHPSCTPSPWHRHRARSPAAATTTFLYSPPRRHAGSTKRDCCYVALGDQQVSPSSSSSSSKTKAMFRRSLARSHTTSSSPLGARKPVSFSDQPTFLQIGTPCTRSCLAFFFLHLMILDN